MEYEELILADNTGIWLRRKPQIDQEIMNCLLSSVDDDNHDLRDFLQGMVGR